MKEHLTAQELKEAIVFGIQEKKGKDIVILDLRKLGDNVTDFFIICHGDSTTQVSAIADSIYEEVKKISKTTPWHTEGKQHAQWILLDYVDIVVHVFQKELRDFYGIEELWNDAERTEVKSE